MSQMNQVINHTAAKTPKIHKWRHVYGIVATGSALILADLISEG
jgi:hypothetical protein